VKKIVAAGNTMVPALLELERLGFVISTSDSGPQTFTARRDDEVFVAEDPVSLLGLLKLVDSRGWDWRPNDSEIEATMRRYKLG